METLYLTITSSSLPQIGLPLRMNKSMTVGQLRLYIYTYKKWEIEGNTRQHPRGGLRKNIKSMADKGSDVSLNICHTITLNRSCCRFLLLPCHSRRRFSKLLLVNVLNCQLLHALKN